MPRVARLPRLDRPREKLVRSGAESLSESELLAVILGSGSVKRGVMELASDAAKIFAENPNGLTIEKLSKIKGLGRVHALRLMAVHELARRRAETKSARIARPEDILPHVAFIADRHQEHLVVVSLSGSGKVIATRVVSVGLLDSTPIHSREVFADAVADRAAGVIIAHNHPSGDVKPSRRDRAVTKRLAKAGRLLGIPLLDHVILAERTFFSFRKKGLMGTNL